MLHGKNVKLFIGILAVAALVVLFVWYKPALLPGEVAAPDDGAAENAVLDSSAEISGREIIIPSGRQEYQVMQTEDRWPKILEAVIDPPDVHVGDTQRLEIVVQSRAPISKVEAHIETDNDTVVLPLELVGEVSDAELLPQRYAVLDNGAVVILSKEDKQYGANRTKIAHAQEQPLGVVDEEEPNLPKLKYAGEWVVRDTHETTYHTTFVVKDVSGNENSITIAWTDFCGIPTFGGGPISIGNCTVSALEGVSGGTATITGTLTLDAPFTWDPGLSIVLSGSGNIILNSASAYLTQAYLFLPDTDNDFVQGTLSSTSLTTSTSVGIAGKIRRVNASSVNDCNDNNAFIYRNVGNLTPDGDNDGIGSGAAPSTQCVGTEMQYTPPAVGFEFTFYTGSTGSPWQWLLNPGGTADCNDANANVQSNNSTVVDNDVDGYVVSASAQCLSAGTGSAIGCSATTNHSASHYKWNSSGVCVLYQWDFIQFIDDCYDFNADANDSQTSYFTSDRGDGSFDYDCDSSQTQERTNTGSCVNVSDSFCSGCPGACQQQVVGWRTDFAPDGCSLGVPACGACGAWWLVNQTGCNICQNWQQQDQACR